MAWDFSTEPGLQARLDWAREFVDSTIIPLELISGDLPQVELDALIAPYKAQVKAKQLWAAHLEPEHGGQGMGQLPLALLHEVLGRATLAPEIFGCQAPDSGNAELLAAGANEAQRQRWLTPLQAGELRSCFSLTEPHQAGSDPTDIRTSCERIGDEWVINGEKYFASNASVADFILMMVVTDPDAPPHRRAAMVIVPAGTPGLEILRDVGTMHHPGLAEDGAVSSRIGGHSHLRLSDCRVPLENMVGAPGEGFVLAQKRLGGGRIHHCMRMIGQCRRAFDMMLERAASRQVRGRPLGKQQMVQAMLAECYAEIEMARLLVLRAAWTMDHEGPHSEAARRDISAAKFKVPAVLHKVLDDAIQLHGALGYSSDMPLEEMYRLARALRVADGADEVQKQAVARLLLTKVEAVQGWPSEWLPAVRDAARQRFGEELRAVSGD